MMPVGFNSMHYPQTMQVGYCPQYLEPGMLPPLPPSMDVSDPQGFASMTAANPFQFPTHFTQSSNSLRRQKRPRLMANSSSSKFGGELQLDTHMHHQQPLGAYAPSPSPSFASTQSGAQLEHRPTPQDYRVHYDASTYRHDMYQCQDPATVSTDESIQSPDKFPCENVACREAAGVLKNALSVMAALLEYESKQTRPGQSTEPAIKSVSAVLAKYLPGHLRACEARTRGEENFAEVQAPPAAQQHQPQDSEPVLLVENPPVVPAAHTNSGPSAPEVPALIPSLASGQVKYRDEAPRVPESVAPAAGEVVLTAIANNGAREQLPPRLDTSVSPVADDVAVFDSESVPGGTQPRNRVPSLVPGSGRSAASNSTTARSRHDPEAPSGHQPRKPEDHPSIRLMKKCHDSNRAPALHQYDLLKLPSISGKYPWQQVRRPSPPAGVSLCAETLERVDQRWKQVIIGLLTPGHRNFIKAYSKRYGVPRFVDSGVVIPLEDAAANDAEDEELRGEEPDESLAPLPVLPCPPDIYEACSKRVFDKKLKLWRRNLHIFDDDHTDTDLPQLLPAPDSDTSSVSSGSMRSSKRKRSHGISRNNNAATDPLPPKTVVFSASSAGYEPNAILWRRRVSEHATKRIRFRTKCSSTVAAKSSTDQPPTTVPDSLKAIVRIVGNRTTAAAKSSTQASRSDGASQTSCGNGSAAGDQHPDGGPSGYPPEGFAGGCCNVEPVAAVSRKLTDSVRVEADGYAFGHGAGERATPEEGPFASGFDGSKPAAGLKPSKPVSAAQCPSIEDVACALRECGPCAVPVQAASTIPSPSSGTSASAERDSDSDSDSDSDDTDNSDEGGSFDGDSHTLSAITQRKGYTRFVSSHCRDVPFFAMSAPAYLADDDDAVVDMCTHSVC